MALGDDDVIISRPDEAGQSAKPSSAEWGAKSRKDGDYQELDAVSSKGYMSRNFKRV